MTNAKKLLTRSIIPLFALSLTLAMPCRARAPRADAPADSAEGVHAPSLIAQSDGMEQRFLYQNLILEERDLTDYLSEILEKLATPEERRRYRLRARVLRSSAFNAFAAPNGTVFVCTGLLARVVNETQVAAVLAHELGHIVLDHTEKNLLEMKRQALGLVSDGSRQDINAHVLNGEISETAVGDALRVAVAGYTERVELEADSLAVVRMAAAGYEPPADFRVFIILIRDGGGGGSQPAGKRDVRKSQTLSAADDDIERGYFNVKLGGVMLYEAMMNHAAGQPELVEPLLDRLLAVDSCDVAALIRRGDMERQLSPRSVASIEWYERALACSPGNPAALRAIGFAYYAVGNMDEARRYLRAYCVTAGGAADIKMAKELLRRCETRRGK